MKALQFAILLALITYSSTICSATPQTEKQLFFVDSVVFVKSDSCYKYIAYENYRNYQKKKPFKDKEDFLEGVSNKTFFLFDQNLLVLTAKTNAYLDTLKLYKTFKKLNDAVINKYYFIRVKVHKIVDHFCLDWPMMGRKEKLKAANRDYYYTISIVDPITETVVYKSKNLSSIGIPEGKEYFEYFQFAVAKGKAKDTSPMDPTQFYTFYHYCKSINEIITNGDAAQALTKFASSEACNKKVAVDITKPQTSLTAAELRNAIATIGKGNAKGSATIISTDGYCVTTYSNVSADSKKTANLNGKDMTYQIIGYDHDHDLALIKLSSTEPLKALPSAFISESNIGEQVTTVGFDAGSVSLSKGSVSGIRKIENTAIIQTDAKINRSMVGGAIVDKSNNLIGIVSTKLIGIDIEGIGFGIDIKSVFELLSITVK